MERHTEAEGNHYSKDGKVVWSQGRRAMAWQPYNCKCGYLVCRQAAQACGKCGRSLGPVTKAQERRNFLLGRGWVGRGDHWTHPSHPDVISFSLAAAYRTEMGQV